MWIKVRERETNQNYKPMWETFPVSFLVVFLFVCLLCLQTKIKIYYNTFVLACVCTNDTFGMVVQSYKWFDTRQLTWNFCILIRIHTQTHRWNAQSRIILWLFIIIVASLLFSIYRARARSFGIANKVIYSLITDNSKISKMPRTTKHRLKKKIDQRLYKVF